MKAIQLILPVLILALMLIIAAGDCRAQSLDLSGFVVDTRQGKLAATFSLDVQDFEKIKAALDRGSKLALVCRASLLKGRLIIRDRSLAERMIEIGLEKDLLSGQYSIFFPEKRLSLSSFEQEDFIRHFSDISLELFPLDNLVPEQKYIVRIELQLISREIPNWIKRILFFWNWDMVRPVRYEMEFSL